MIKREMDDGRVLDLSMDLVSGGVMVSMVCRYPEGKGKEDERESFVMSPSEVSELIEGLSSGRAVIRALDGRCLAFCGLGVYSLISIATEGESGLVPIISFPLREHEVRFVKIALENMADLLMSADRWSGDPDKW